MRSVGSIVFRFPIIVDSRVKFWPISLKHFAMDEKAFSDYAIAECNERGIDLRQLHEEQDTFAKEAFRFLKRNAHLWIEYPAEFLLKHTDEGNYTLFSPIIGHAVILKAFLKRIEYKRIMIPKLDELASPECYRRLIVEYSATKDTYYFFNYLDWISFIYTLTMFCYKEGHDYYELGKQCLAGYSEIVFYQRGGWTLLNQAAYIVLDSTMNRFSTAILLSENANDNVVRFLKARKKHERRYRYETNKWTTLTSGELTANDVREKISAKFSVASDLDSRRVVAGYKVLLNNESSNMLKRNKRNFSKKDQRTFANETHRKTASGSKEATAEIASRVDLIKISDQEDLFQMSNMTECTKCKNKFRRVVMCNAMTQTDPCTSFDSRDSRFNSAFEMDKNIVFLISQRLLRHTDAIDDLQSYVHQRGIKICSPSTNRDHLIGSLEVLDENIRDRNFHYITDEVLVVSPPGCDYEDEDTTVMVLDTSTEDEDDDEFKAPQLLFVHNVSSEAHIGVTVSQPALGISYNPGEMAHLHVKRTVSATECPEQRQFLPTRSTGAIPKVKTSTQPETRYIATEALAKVEVDLETPN